VHRILREMRIAQQNTGSLFDYCEFRRQVADTTMSPAQLGPLTQRLDTLESFMPPSQISTQTSGKNKNQRKMGLSEGGTDWTSTVWHTQDPPFAGRSDKS
jgi:hypothetical protein